METLNLYVTWCRSRKHPYLPQGKVTDIPREVSKAKIFKGNYEAKLEFIDGGLEVQFTFCVTGYGYFLAGATHIYIQALRKELQLEGILYKVTFSEKDLDSSTEVFFEKCLMHIIHKDGLESSL